MGWVFSATLPRYGVVWARATRRPLPARAKHLFVPNQNCKIPMPDPDEFSESTLFDLAQGLLDAARRAGAEASDALVVAERSVAVDWREGALEHFERAEEIALGLRVFVGHRHATVAASDQRAETLRTLAERAVAMARDAPEDPFAGLAAPEQLSPRRDAAGLELADSAGEPAPEWLMDQAAKAEAAGLAVKGVARTDGAAAAWGYRRVVLVASNGFAGGYATTSASISATMITSSGATMERDWAAETRVFRADLPDAAEIGALAGARAAARAGARKAPSGRFPVVFDERVAASLIGHLLAAINGQAVARGASWLCESLERQILPRGLSLVEEPLRVRGLASRPFDDEGLPTKTRTFVEDGMLKSFVLDLASARKLGLAPTGNASRSVSGPPSPGTTNLTLTAGTESREDLLRAMGRGFLVTHFLGATINPTTGDYSRGAAGFWIDGGEIAYPVHEVTLAGKLREILQNVVPANDARPWARARVPSLLVEGLTLAGA